MTVLTPIQLYSRRLKLGKTILIIESVTVRPETEHWFKVQYLSEILIIQHRSSNLNLTEAGSSNPFGLVKSSLWMYLYVLIYKSPTEQPN